MTAGKEGKIFLSLERIPEVLNQPSSGWCCLAAQGMEQDRAVRTYDMMQEMCCLFLLSEVNVAGRNTTKKHFPAAGAGA